jgi:hypothetical protein
MAPNGIGRMELGVEAFETASRSAPATRIAAALSAALVVIATLYPRMALLGGLPFTDEGFYGATAQFIHASIAAGAGLPDHGLLDVYPTLLSWIFSLDGNPLLLLRLADMLVAIVAGWLLLGIAQRECNDPIAGAVIAAAFCFAMNQQAFVQYGFRNSIFAAYVPLLLALRIGLYRSDGDHRKWWLCGALAAFAVLLRETFVHFAALGFVAILAARGLGPALRYAAGGLLAGLATLVLFALARGGFAGLLEAYFQASDTYAAVADTRLQRLQVALATAAIEGAVALPFAVAGAAAVIALREGARDTQRAWFWVCVALVPLLEPLLKIGYGYHVAVSAIGLCGLASIGWRRLSSQPHRIANTVAAVVLVVAVPLALVQVFKLNFGLAERMVNLQAIGTRAFPPQAIPQSHYLLLAETIKKAVPGARTLAVSGGALVLFPLTGLAPSSYRLYDLSDAALRIRHDTAALRRAINACPPDVLVVTSRPQKLWGREALLETLSGMPEYLEVPRVPVARYEDFKAYPGGREVENPPPGRIFRRNAEGVKCDARVVDAALRWSLP